MLVGGYDQTTQMAQYVTYDTHTPLHAAAERPILFLESKSIQDLEATLTLLKQSGDLGHYQAIVLGKYTGNPNQINPDFPEGQVTQILQKIGIEENMPVFHGVAFGHGPRGAELRTVPLYTPTTLVVDGSKATMTVATTSPQDALDRRAALTVVPQRDSYTQHTPAATFNTIGFDQPFITTIHQLYTQDMQDKDVVLRFPFDAKSLANSASTINPAHCVLMPLVTSGKLQQAKSITLSADGEFSPAFNAWLKEFAEQHLPNVTVSTARAKPKETPVIRLDDGHHDHNNITAPSWNPAARAPGKTTSAPTLR